MGYPMTWQRMCHRNHLEGDYGDTNGMVAGDLRRIETDTRDKLHLTAYARHAGITTKQAKSVFNLFFDSYAPAQEVLSFEDYAKLSDAEGTVNWLIGPGTTLPHVDKPDAP